METKKTKIAVVDPVGEKAGMNYYNLGLLGGLSQLGVEPYLFSNTTHADERVVLLPYFGKFYNNKLKQAWNEVWGHIRAFAKCKQLRVDYVIMHVFSTQFFFLLFFVLAKLFRLKVVSIAHDVSSLAADDSSLNKDWIYNRLSSKVIVHNNYSLQGFVISFHFQNKYNESEINIY